MKPTLGEGVFPTTTHVTPPRTAGVMAPAYPSLSFKPQCEWEMLLTEVHLLWLLQQHLCTCENDVTASRAPLMLSTSGKCTRPPSQVPYLAWDFRNKSLVIPVSEIQTSWVLAPGPHLGQVGLPSLDTSSLL